MPTNRLTDAACRAAKPKDKPYKLADGQGMALWCSPTGARAWRLYYRVDGKPQTKSLGAYPEVGLAEARRLRDVARAALRAGQSLTTRKRSSVSVQQACTDYLAGREDITSGYRDNILRAFELHLWPELGAVDVAALTRDQVLSPLVALDAAGRHEYPRKLRMWLDQVLAWCVARGTAAHNVAREIDPARAFGRRTVAHHAALDLRDVPALVQRLALEGALQSAIACRLLALTWARTTELRMMRWDELDGDVWRLPAGRMKRKRDHLVPLSRQALGLIDAMRVRQLGGVFVFPAEHRVDRPMSENSVLYLLKRLGYGGRMTGHGWRTIGSTWAHEAGYPPDVIERQLAHVPDDKVRSAYNRAAYMPQRAAMLQAFADWLDGCAGMS